MDNIQLSRIWFNSTGIFVEKGKESVRRVRVFMPPFRAAVVRSLLDETAKDLPCVPIPDVYRRVA